VGARGGGSDRTTGGERLPGSRLYRLLLRAYPGSWRDEYGEAMEEVFEARLSEVRLRGLVVRFRFWAREIAGAGWTGLRARLRRDDPEAGGGGRAVGRWIEFRHAARRLHRAPAFTLAVITTLALALAANVSIFTLVQRIVVRPLPYEDSAELIDLSHALPGLGPGEVGMTEAMYVLYGDSPVLDGLALYQQGTRTLQAGGEPERLNAAVVTPSLGRVLGVPAARGRWFSDSDVDPGAPGTAVISHALWMRQFGGAPVVGITVRIEGVPTDVIGVMPETFAFPRAGIDLWLPLRVDRASPQVGGFNFLGVARRVIDSDLEAVGRDLQRIIATLPRAFPGDIATAMIQTGRLTATPAALKESVLRGVERTLWVLLGGVAIVMLVACANIANLLLTRTEARQRELAVRRALGSGRRGILTFFLAEGVILAGTGGILGTVLGWAALKAMMAGLTVPLPRLHEIRMDAGILTFATLLTAAAAAAFTLIPLLRRAPALTVAVREGGRLSSAGRDRMTARGLLMAAQLALALVLLTGGGLMLRSFLTLRSIDPGFEPASALTFRIGLPASSYGTAGDGRQVGAHHEILDRVAALPGVRSAALATCLPLDGFCFGDPILVDGADLQPDEIPPIVAMRRVSSGYFDTMEMSILRGGTFDHEHDVAAGARAAVVSERLAALYFGDADPIGQRISPAWGRDDVDWYTVIGVVADVPTNTLMESVTVPALYLPFDVGEEGPGVARAAYVLRTDVQALSLVGPVRASIRRFDSNLPVASVETLPSILARDGAPLAFAMVLLLLASGVALLLGVIGTWGTIAYIVGQRTGEIGVRLVLGARPGEVSAMIVRQAGLPAFAGLVTGLLVALAGSHLIQSMLFRVDARDPITYATVSGLLAMVAFLACWLPARRAARLDPASAIRTR
jgi:putative ABC transport system permease protein